MQVTIEISEDNVNVTLEALKDAKTRALMKCGAMAENYAKQDTPVDTGRLRNSIAHEMEDDNTVDIGTDVEYAIYQELGTSRGVPEHRFLTNGVRDHIDEYQQIIENELRNS